MYAHCVIQPLNSLQVQFDLPPEFTDCREAEIIVLPIKSARLNEQEREEWVHRMVGTLSDNFPDDGSGHEEIHAKDREIERQEAMARLGKIRINFGGKPMTDREEANAR